MIFSMNQKGVKDMDKDKNKDKNLTSICNNCEHNEDGFCLANLESCRSIKISKQCGNYLDKEINWDISDSPYQEYGQLYEDWINGQLNY
jgi:hypothetical protein